MKKDGNGPADGMQEPQPYTEYVLQCEDSLTGVLTGIYEAAMGRLAPQHTVLIAGEEHNYRLFAQYVTVTPNAEKAGKVERKLRRSMGDDVYRDLCLALSSEDENKAEAVYRTVMTGLSMPNPGQVMGRLADSYVYHAFELSRNATFELHHLLGFLRFQERGNGLLLAIIGPKNNILPFLTPHFADRLPMENFAIYDNTRDLLALHPAGMEWYLRSGMQGPEEGQNSGREKEYQELFHCFCHTIAIKERSNRNLQRQMLPLRFQKYMTEFDDLPQKYRE